MVLPVYNCFHPILRQKSVNVTEFNADLSKFHKNMLDTMYQADGIGLAANQVGDTRSMLIVDEFSGDDEVKGNPLI